MNVVDSKDRHRYELTDGDELIGFAEYHLHRNEIAFLHTEIRPELAGKGFAGRLIEAALHDARDRGLAVLPYCPFVRNWLHKHPDYRDLVPATHRAKFDI